VDGRIVPFVEGRIVPFVDGRIVPFVEGRIVPFVEGRIVPFVEGRIVPFVEGRTVPVVEGRRGRCCARDSVLLKDRPSAETARKMKIVFMIKAPKRRLNKVEKISKVRDSLPY
jgi:hypothetical protein